jgi:protein phosphatase 2C-like protein
VFWPQKGEYANMTFFLTDENSVSRAQVANLPDETLDVALFTDGLEPLALQFSAQKAHEPFFRTAFAPLHACTTPGESTSLSQSLAQMLTSPAARTRTDDDTTLILATRRASSS